MNLEHQNKAIGDILAERRKQFSKWGEQRHNAFVWMSILGEEVGELNECALHETFGGSEAQNFKKEAIQVAAVALQILEWIEAGRPEN